MPDGSPAHTGSVRAHNLALILGQIAQASASRARLAAATGLTKATTSSLVDTLLGGGLVQELAPATGAGAGRPGTRIALAPNGCAAIGLEINVDYLASCTIDLTGAVRHRHLVAEDFRGDRGSRALDRAAGALTTAVTDARAAGLRIAGVSVAVPGLVDRTGLVRLAPNLGWHDLPVLAELRRRAELPEALPMRVDNEANLAALAELWRGGHTDPDGAPLRTFVHVSGEIGVGAGIIADGALWRGQRGFSGEIGHIPVPYGANGFGESAAAAICSCGSVGCLEQVAGQEAILRAAGISPDATAGTFTGSQDGAVRALIKAVARGDDRARAAVTAAGSALGVALASLLNVLDGRTVVLGGLYGRLADVLRPAIEREASRRVIAARWEPVQVLASRLGTEGAVLGGATAVVRSVMGDPAAFLARA